jgi:MoxR-like ATPase
MPWTLFSGSGKPQQGATRAWESIPPLPPWRSTGGGPPSFQVPDGAVTAVNAALHLRRPLLLTGLPGSGKSTLVEMIAAELQLGPVLRWHITSKTTLTDGLYQYDALGRLHATQVEESRRKAGQDPAGLSDVERFVTLGPLGTALASPGHPRAVLIDEIDKSDLDLPSDLLNVLEVGEFDIPPLVRDTRDADAVQQPEVVPRTVVRYRVRGTDRDMYDAPGGVVRAEHFPVIVFTSNGERTFPPPFLRRCIRFEMPRPTAPLLERIVAGHLGAVADKDKATIEQFAQRLRGGDILAIDQLLSLLYPTTGHGAPGTDEREELASLILAELNVR